MGLCTGWQIAKASINFEQWRENLKRDFMHEATKCGKVHNIEQDKEVAGENFYARSESIEPSA